jgi:hypothetical protein
LEGATTGDPTSLVKWTRKSTRSVSRALRISHSKAWKMVRAENYRLGTTESVWHDRNQQFQEIN